MLEELSMVYLEASDEQVIMSLLGIFQQIVCLGNMHLFYPLIITTILGKFKLIVNPKYYLYLEQKNNTNNSNIFFNIIPISTNVDINKLSKEKKLDYLFKTGPYQSKNILIISKSFDVFISMNEVNTKHFVGFLPLIVNTCTETGIINYAETKSKIKEILIDFSQFIFMDNNNLKKRMNSQLCRINCIFGFSSKNQQRSEIDIYKDNIWAKARFRQSLRIRKTKEDNMRIIKQFDTYYCSVEEDWNEWFKSTSKILFEQSTIYALYLCHVVADYYFPLVIELYNYGFFSIYINMSDNNKLILINNIQKALNNAKTPNDILLNILNLSEFLERRNIHLQFINYKQFGHMAYKCRAFAKALYYKENDFLLTNDFEHVEGLLELYYELKHPESAIGLLKLAENNKDKFMNLKKDNDEENIYTNKYMLYIKLHEYDKALQLINEKLSTESDQKKIEIL